jgi:hypothetical protein
MKLWYQLIMELCDDAAKNLPKTESIGANGFLLWTQSEMNDDNKVWQQ